MEHVNNYIRYYQQTFQPSNDDHSLSPETSSENSKSKITHNHYHVPQNKKSQIKTYKQNKIMEFHGNEFEVIDDNNDNYETEYIKGTKESTSYDFRYSNQQKLRKLMPNEINNGTFYRVYYNPKTGEIAWA